MKNKELLDNLSNSEFAIWFLKRFLLWQDKPNYRDYENFLIWLERSVD